MDRALTSSLEEEGGETTTDTETTLDSSSDELVQHISSARIEGYKTAKFLFDFGATCLERFVHVCYQKRLTFIGDFNDVNRMSGANGFAPSI